MPAQMSRKCRFREMNGAKICLHYVERGAGPIATLLKSGARPEFMVIGNMTEAQATTLVRHVQKNSWALMVQRES